MVVVAQGDIFWADLPAPAGSKAGFRRPVVVVQGDAFNQSAVATIVCVPLTSNLRWAEAPGNVRLPKKTTRLAKDSVANVAQIVAIDRELLARRVGRVSARQMQLILSGVDIVLGR